MTGSSGRIPTAVPPSRSQADGAGVASTQEPGSDRPRTSNTGTGDQFTASVRVHYFDVELDEGSFTTAVIGFNGSYSFTPSLYLQANVQYNDDTRGLGTNLRLGWLDTAGTGLFIVYNDAYQSGRFEDTGIPAGPKQRQLVIKYTKLFDVTR